MKSVTQIEKNGYVVVKNPNPITIYKSIDSNYTIGSGERSLFFGRITVNSILRVEGELDVLKGISVLTAPSGLSYSDISVNENVFVSVSPTLLEGIEVSYSISPSLPNGLSINQSTGIISGTPTTNQESTPYTVTASNNSGSTTATINITILANAPSGLSYNNIVSSIFVFTTSSPTLNVGTPPLTYSISPSLPNGLSIDSSTGVISGTTPSTSNDTTYTITATNEIGNTTVSFRIRIVYVNTIMTIGSNIDGEGFGSIGFSNSFSFGSLTTSTFRSGTITELYSNVDSFGQSFLDTLFKISYVANDTDEESFKQIIWNDVVYLRSASSYDTDGSTYSSWSISDPPAFDLENFVTNGTPTTVTLLIE